MAPANEPSQQPPPSPSPSPSSPPSDQPFSIFEPSSKYHGTPPLLHTLTLAATILAPIGLLLPPRRLSLQTTVLSAGAFYGASQLTHDYTGRSIYARLGGDARKQRMQADQSRHEAAAQARADEGNGGWMKERVMREREVLAEGRGYWGLITDQVWEVWNGEWNRKKKGEDGGRDGSSGGSEKS